jgi:hypothetical protein
MRKFLISAAAVAIALTAAAPAAAQYYPPAPQGYGYGYNNYGQVRRLEARVDQLRRHIVQLDRRNILSNREAARLREQARDIRNDLRRAGRDGFNHREINRFHQRIAQLEHRIRREASDGNRYNRGYGDRDRYSDRDRDGRNDRFEDDRGYDHD